MTNNPEFARLQHLQKNLGNITTYVGGELTLVEYPENAEGGPVNPAHVWMMITTHAVPRLFCFHGREAWVRMPGPDAVGMALCRSEDDSCGYLVDFFGIANHPNVRTKIYNYRESAISVAIETTADRGGFEADAMFDFALDDESEYIPSPSESMSATRATTPNLEILGDMPETPPCTAQDARHACVPPQNQEESDQKLSELFASLRTQGGVAKGRFWQVFRQCQFCPFIVKKNGNHTCIPAIDLTTEDDATIIDLTNDDEMD